jgi:hypothetical protein
MIDSSARGGYTESGLAIETRRVRPRKCRVVKQSRLNLLRYYIPSLRLTPILYTVLIIVRTNTRWIFYESLLSSDLRLILQITLL